MSAPEPQWAAFDAPSLRGLADRPESGLAPRIRATPALSSKRSEQAVREPGIARLCRDISGERELRGTDLDGGTALRDSEPAQAHSVASGLWTTRDVRAAPYSY